jgi:hypothetical protein
MKRHLFLTVTLVMFFSLAANAFAATRYVAPTGNNRNPGTESRPWATLAHAAHNISNGDMVIIGGGIYSSGFTIHKSNVTFRAKSGEIPIIDGDGVRPGGEWDTLVLIMADGGTNLANNVTIDGLTIRRSTGYGLQVVGQKGGADNAVIKNCKIYQTYRMGLMVKNGADNALIEDCEVFNCCTGMHGGYTGNQPICTGGQRPPQVSTKYCDSPTFRRCKIYDSYHEGFDIDVGTTNATVEYCEIYGSPQVQLYLVNSTNNTVRYNLIYGTDNGTGSGIYICNEAQWKTPVLLTNNKIYGNVVANTTNNLWIAGATGRLVKNVTVYNNTFVEATVINTRMEKTTGGDHVFKNNIIWQTNGTIANVPSGKMTCAYNLWSRKPDDDAKGAHDPTYALPKLIKTSGWNNLSGGDLDGSEFALQSASTAIDAGIPIGAEFDNIPECNKSVWPGQIVVMDQANQGSGWEIGADIHVVNSTALDSPTNLRITAEQ